MLINKNSETKKEAPRHRSEAEMGRRGHEDDVTARLISMPKRRK